MTSRAQEKFKALKLADARLEARAVRLAEQLAQSPGASLPQACGDWGQTQAAYRFLANEDTSAETVLEAHAQASMARMGAQKVVLCLQDTTELEFDGQRAPDLVRSQARAVCACAVRGDA